MKHMSIITCFTLNKKHSQK